MEDEKDNLAGKKIVALRKMTKAELKREGWDEETMCLQLDDGSILYPSQDEEGNGPGALLGLWQLAAKKGI